MDGRKKEDVAAAAKGEEKNRIGPSSAPIFLCVSQPVFVFMGQPVLPGSFLRPSLTFTFWVLPFVGPAINQLELFAHYIRGT